VEGGSKGRVASNGSAKSVLSFECAVHIGSGLRERREGRAYNLEHIYHQQGLMQSKGHFRWIWYQRKMEEEDIYP